MKSWNTYLEHDIHTQWRWQGSASQPGKAHWSWSRHTGTCELAPVGETHELRSSKGGKMIPKSRSSAYSQERGNIQSLSAGEHAHLLSHNPLSADQLHSQAAGHRKGWRTVNITALSCKASERKSILEYLQWINPLDWPPLHWPALCPSQHEQTPTGAPWHWACTWIRLKPILVN